MKWSIIDKGTIFKVGKDWVLEYPKYNEIGSTGIGRKAYLSGIDCDPDLNYTYFLWEAVILNKRELKNLYKRHPKYTKFFKERELTVEELKEIKYQIERHQIHDVVHSGLEWT